jgi:hypothetical protein
MTKSIADLSADIYNVLDATVEHTPDEVIAASYAMRIGGEFAKATLKRDKPREKGKLWASDLGKKCLRQHWYNFNMPEAGTALLGYTKFKFLYGNILEEAVLYMAEEAGHEVAELQTRVEYEVERPITDWAISGRIDAVIDGVLVDVKSTSSFGFSRYKYGINSGNDSFGYIQQLSFYHAFGKFTCAGDQAGFVWIDKQNGHITYTDSPLDTREQLIDKANAIIDAVETDDEQLVPKAYEPEAYGKSGNMALPMPCSYCSFKRQCWKDSNGGRGVRTFAYSHKPVDLVEVKREPKAPEILHAATEGSTSKKEDTTV